MAVSKNNPNQRKAAVAKFYQGKQVKPVKYMGKFGSYIAAQDEGGNIIFDNNKKPIPFKQLSNYA